MAYSKYRNVPVADIRAASITYEQLVMRWLDLLSLSSIECVKEENYKRMDVMIRLIDSIYYPYHDKEYKAKRKKIIASLETIKASGDFNYEYFKVLLVWVKLFASKFAVLDILPEHKVDFLAGQGEIDPRTGEVVEDDDDDEDGDYE